MTFDHRTRDSEVARILDRQRRRSLKIAANDFEQATRLRLIGLGFLNVEIVATPMAFNRRTQRHFRTRAVSGDIKAMEPGTGRAVLCECKLYPDGLPFGALAPHQVTRLDECAAGGGLALLSWGGQGQLHLLVWRELRAAGFRPQASVTPDRIKASAYLPPLRNHPPSSHPTPPAGKESP